MLLVQSLCFSRVFANGTPLADVRTVLWVGPKGGSSEEAQSLPRHALEEAGFRAETAGVRDDAWLVWSHESPFNTFAPSEPGASAAAAAGAALAYGDAVNHIPGVGAITSKRRLALLARSKMLRMPRTYLDPKELARRFTEPSPPPVLVAKSDRHGSVRLVDSRDPRHEDRAFFQDQFLQEQVPSLLVDGGTVDLGFYVLLVPGEGCSPRAYVAQTPLLRFSYPGQPFVKSNYRPAWERAPPPKSSSSGRQSSLRELLEDVVQQASGEGAWEALWVSARALIAQVLQNAWPSLRPRCLELQRGGVRVFELVRFDFIPDASGKPWLHEVNSSPNMAPLPSHPVEDATWRMKLLRAIVGILKDGSQPMKDGAVFTAMRLHVNLEEPARRRLQNGVDATSDAPESVAEKAPAEEADPEAEAELEAEASAEEGYAESRAEDAQILVAPAMFATLVPMSLISVSYYNERKQGSWMQFTLRPSALVRYRDIMLGDNHLLQSMDESRFLWSVVKLCAPCSIALLMCPVALYSFADVMSLYFPPDTTFDIDRLTMGANTFLLLVGILYAVMLGQVYGTALERYTQLSQLTNEIVHNLSQLLAITDVSMCLDSSTRNLIAEIIRHVLIQFFSFSARCERTVRSKDFTDLIWQLMPIFRENATDGTDDDLDREILPVVMELCLSLGKSMTEYRSSFQQRIHRSSWLILEILSAITYMSTLMIQAGSQPLELTFCFTSVFIIALVLTVLADLDMPYVGWCTIDLTDLKDVLKHCNTVLDRTTLKHCDAMIDRTTNERVSPFLDNSEVFDEIKDDEHSTTREKMEIATSQLKSRITPGSV
ncbi:hypothetical protein CYMTET_37990 [Cymbomonas tetramitiformis]|uniref:Tubulin-tyrosine ligase n=1 Tax=Cymbomonas tetramitiformis TaxID=36881 RepID=A0AAE0F5W9_9CHLO|nr:hypothetical protein CYMTET_37990 [Cymbomonas tetramitiformis]